MYGDGGGCYKHTFYNISSFQCMEMTPSLACANKCVFCWRHHTNPVARNGAVLDTVDAPCLQDGDRIEMGEVVFTFRGR